MNLIRFQPIFPEMESLRRQMDQIFDELVVNNPVSHSRDYATPWKPAIELQDHTEYFLLKVALPGIDGKNVDVQVTKDAVAISGEVRSPQQETQNNSIRSEFHYGKFQRILSLPADIINEKVEAKFDQGILSLTLPKQESQRRTVIKLNLGDANPSLEQSREQASQAVDVNQN